MTADKHITVRFEDHHRTAQCKPDPRFPNGQNVDASHHASHACTVAIPYPAPRCGLMVVECSKCDLRVALTVAGRPDDPRSVKIACNIPRGVPIH